MMSFICTAPFHFFFLHFLQLFLLTSSFHLQDLQGQLFFFEERREERGEKREERREEREEKERREKRREERRRERRTDRKKDRQKEEREQERRRAREKRRRKTPPCVRPERTHGGVLNLHMEGFSACQAAPHHTKQHHTPHNTPPTQRTRHITHHMRTTMSTHTHHTHTTHTHTQQPTVILTRKSECSDMRTIDNRP